LCTDIGWKHDGTIKELETKRKKKADKRWQKKKELTKLRQAAVMIVDRIIPKIQYGDPIKIGSL
jgi:hypothetical protein